MKSTGNRVWSRWSDSQHDQRHGRGWHAEVSKEPEDIFLIGPWGLEISGGATL